jgi:hypothetical protein
VVVCVGGGSGYLLIDLTVHLCTILQVHHYRISLERQIIHRLVIASPAFLPRSAFVTGLTPLLRTFARKCVLSRTLFHALIQTPSLASLPLVGTSLSISYKSMYDASYGPP